MNFKDTIAQINKPQTWLVLTEGWCGDAAQIIPCRLLHLSTIFHLLWQTLDCRNRQFKNANIKDKNFQMIKKCNFTYSGKSLGWRHAITTL